MRLDPGKGPLRAGIDFQLKTIDPLYHVKDQIFTKPDQKISESPFLSLHSGSKSAIIAAGVLFKENYLSLSSQTS